MRPVYPISFDEQIDSVDMELKVTIKLMRQNKLVTEFTKSWRWGSGRDELMLVHHVNTSFFF
jgi:hypothetical protein